MIAERLQVYSQEVGVIAAIFALSAILSFLIGSIPFGLLVARAYKVDITKVGSGNIGTTNVWRVLGWKPGLVVLLLDALKGALPVILAYSAYYRALAAYATGTVEPAFAMALLDLPIVAGLAAICGHTFSPWLSFKGGKGIATGLGVAVALFQGWIMVPLVVFLIVLAIGRMVSLASIVAVVALAYESFLMPGYLGHITVFAVIVLLLVLYTHRSNIRRILNGTENKVSFRRKPSST